MSDQQMRAQLKAWYPWWTGVDKWSPKQVAAIYQRCLHADLDKEFHVYAKAAFNCQTEEEQAEIMSIYLDRFNN